jgi:hypothetical protein
MKTKFAAIDLWYAETTLKVLRDNYWAVARTLEEAGFSTDPYEAAVNLLDEAIKSLNP